MANCRVILSYKVGNERKKSRHSFSPNLRILLIAQILPMIPQMVTRTTEKKQRYLITQKVEMRIEKTSMKGMIANLR